MPPKPADTQTAGRPPFAIGVHKGTKMWLQEWNDLTAKAVRTWGPHLIAGTKAKTDIEALCPKYFTMTEPQQVAFWALFAAAISAPESGYDPHSIYWEGAMKNPRHSEGLFQLSYGDQPHNPACKIVKTGGTEYRGHPFEGNIQDPSVNITCAMSILDRQVDLDKGLWPKPNAYYWSVCTSNGGAKVKQQFATYAPQLAFCGVPKTLMAVDDQKEKAEDFAIYRAYSHGFFPGEARGK